MRVAENLRTEQSAAPSGLRARNFMMVGIGVTAFVLYLIAMPRSLDGPQIMDSPRENIGMHTAERLARGDGVSIPMRLPEGFPSDLVPALTPRDAASIDGRVYPQDFAGTILLFAVLLAVWKPLALAFIPAFAVISGFLLVQLMAELLRREPGRKPSWRRPASEWESWSGFAILLLWLAHPGTIFNGSRIMDSGIVGGALLLLGSIYFVRAWRNRLTLDLVLFALCMGAAITMRYPNILFAVPLGAALLLRVPVRRWLIMTPVLVLFAGVVLVFNAAVYGSPLTTGYHLSSELLRGTVNFSGDSFFRVRPSAVQNHLYFYLWRAPLVLAPAFAGFLLLAAGFRRTRLLFDPGILASLLAANAIMVTYHLGLDTWGSAMTAVNASLIRYVLPVIGLGLIALILNLTWRSRLQARLVQISIALLVGGSAVTALIGPLGVRDRFTMLDEQRALRTLVLSHTSEDALIASRLSDRYLFPDRQTLTMTYLESNEEPIDKTTDVPVWDHLPTPERFAQIAERLLDRDVKLYLVFDWRLAELPLYEHALTRKHLTLERIGRLPDPIPRLFRISHSNPSVARS